MFARACLLTITIAALAGCSETPVEPVVGSTPTVTSDGTDTVVSGRVYAGSETSNLPLAGADIVVVNGDATLSTRTGSNGYYSLAVAPGTATITASKPGYTSKTWEIDVANSVVLNFTLASQ